MKKQLTQLAGILALLAVSVPATADTAVHDHRTNSDAAIHDHRTTSGSSSAGSGSGILRDCKILGVNIISAVPFHPAVTKENQEIKIKAKYRCDHPVNELVDFLFTAPNGDIVYKGRRKLIKELAVTSRALPLQIGRYLIKIGNMSTAIEVLGETPKCLKNVTGIRIDHR